MRTSRLSLLRFSDQQQADTVKRKHRFSHLMKVLNRGLGGQTRESIKLALRMLESFLLKEVELNGVVFADFCVNSSTFLQIFIFRSTLEFHLLTGCRSTPRSPLCVPAMIPGANQMQQYSAAYAQVLIRLFVMYFVIIIDHTTTFINAHSLHSCSDAGACRLQQPAGRRSRARRWQKPLHPTGSAVCDH